MRSRLLNTIRDRRQILPILRLPTTIFPDQCFSLSVDPPGDERLYNVLSPEQLHEVWADHGGRVVTLAWGASIGVELRLLDDAAARDAPFPTPLGVSHAIGGQRLQLLELIGERSSAGSRLGLVTPLDDEDATADGAQLHNEAAVARKLLDSAPTPIELTPCTLDEELGLTVCDPRCHPLWLYQAQVPDGDAELSLWLARRKPTGRPLLSAPATCLPPAHRCGSAPTQCWKHRRAASWPYAQAARLSLTTALRSHLLACTDPLKRMRDCVDAMRLLADPRHARSPDFAKFTVVWDTAESGGCELAPPVATIDWAKHAHK